MKKLFFLFLLSVLIQAPVWAATATAELKPTADLPVSGTVKLEDTSSGLKITADLENAPAGQHGFHIHEFGACTNQGKDAGGHFNPAGTAHGFLPKDGPQKAHSGDFGNIEVGADGKGHLELTAPGITLSGNDGVAGHAMILHAGQDKFTQPAGDAGDRIACGVIELDK